MRAMLLAAGLGTRLRPLTLERPKPAVPVGNRPLAWFALDHLARSGVTDVAINTHHLADRLPALLAPHLPDALRVRYLHEPRILGTGGGIRNAAELLLDGDEPVLVTNADMLYAPDLAAAAQTHRRLGAIATMVLRPDPAAERYGAVEIDAEGRVCRLLGQPADAPEGVRSLMFSGVHLLSPRAFEALPERGCIVRECYRRWVDRGEVVGGHVDDSRWRDLGTVRGYLEANLELAAGGLRWPGIAPGPDGTLVHDGAAIAAGATVRRAVVGAGARVAAGARLERAVVWDGAAVDGEVRGAVVTPARIVAAD